MEENNNKNNMSELVKLMHKTEKAMEMTREKGLLIEIMEEDLMNETRPMMVEKRKTEIHKNKQEKSEFDQMTVDALRRAKTEVLKIREQSEKEYQDKLLETIEKRKAIENKLNSMKQKGLPEEKLSMAKNSAEKALTKVNDEMKKYQDNHFVKRAKLDEFESQINKFGIELNVDIEPLTQAELEKDEPKDNETEVKKHKDGETAPKANEEQENSNEENVNEEAEMEEYEDVGLTNNEGSNSNPTRTGKLIEVKVNGKNYEFIYEENGEISSESKEKLGFFKSLKERFNLVRQGKLGWLKTAFKIDPTITQNLTKKEMQEYIAFIEQRGENKAPFIVKYDKKGLVARAFAKSAEKLGLPEPVKNESKNLDEKFGEGFDQHDNPPEISNKENENVEENNNTLVNENEERE